MESLKNISLHYKFNENLRLFMDYLDANQSFFIFYILTLMGLSICIYIANTIYWVSPILIYGLYKYPVLKIKINPKVFELLSRID